MKERLIVLMSGGVDSSVAAALLKRQGYDVIGVYILGWLGSEKFPCPWQQEEKDAQIVAKKLDIPFYTINLVKEYEREVVKRFLDDYKAGLTPNPDILCNKEIKFKALWRAMRQFEPDKIATGHYARLQWKVLDPNQTTNGQTTTKLKINQPVIAKARDKDKDQTYFLWAIEKEMLPKIIFPLGDYLKSEVRILARQFNLPTATKKDSQGICFIGPLKVRQFLKDNLKPRIGQAVLTDGRIVATHEGATLYTIGQRLGAGSVSWTGDTPPLFVVAKDVGRNLLVVGADKETFVNEAIFNKANWFINVRTPFKAKAKTRYRQESVDCSVTKQKNGYSVRFNQPARAIAPGQSIVFYDKFGTLIGGGKVTAVPYQEKILQKIYETGIKTAN